MENLDRFLARLAPNPDSSHRLIRRESPSIHDVGNHGKTHRPSVCGNRRKAGHFDEAFFAARLVTIGHGHFGFAAERVAKDDDARGKAKQAHPNRRL